MGKKPVALLVCIAIMTATRAGAVDLNAPIDQTPTIGSEMLRGYNSGETCSITLAPLDFSRCIFRIDDSEKRSKTNLDPFEVGLFFSAWQTADIAMQSASRLKDNSIAQAQVPEAHREAARNYIVFRAAERRVGITDDQLIDALKIKPTGAENIKARLVFWAAEQAKTASGAP